jgi:peptide/nickel transport system ATP-binding protein
MSDIILDVCDLRVEFPVEGKSEPVVAVDGISFQLETGQILGIVGESGSGKSVTSLAIMGLIQSPGKITNGTINFKTSQGVKDLTKLEIKDWKNYRGKEIAMIFQEPMSSFNPVYTIGYQLMEAIQLHEPNITQIEAKERAFYRLQQVKVLASNQQLEDKYLREYIEQEKKSKLPITEQIKVYIKEQKESFFKRYPHELSGGQLQRVMIAMAISCNPKILLADEPTTALDVTVQKGILSLLRNLCKEEDMSMIFISHDLGVINEIADSVTVMYKGKVVEKGNKQQILYNPKEPYTKGLLACRPRLHPQLEKLPTVGDFMEQKTPPQYRIISLEEEQARIQKKLQQSTSLLSVKNLSVEFYKSGVFGAKTNIFKAVNDISFQVYSGETLGLVGESGCGKSTLARTILRLIPATKGEINFQGDNIAKLSSSNQKLRGLRREMQIVFQNPYNSLNPRLSIGQAIMEPMVIHKTGGNDSKRKERVSYLLERVGLNPDNFNRYPHEFSGGQRQRICIARALALNPRFIICDESVSALDVSVQAQVLNLLKDLQEEFKLTYIFISHDLSVVRFMSDRIMVMNKGQIEEIDYADKIINNPQKEYTKKLIDSIPHFPENLSWLKPES